MRIELKRPCFLLVTALLLAGCARPTEEQRLAKFRESLRFKAYSFSSSKAVGQALALYHKNGGAPVTEATIHATVGLLCFLAQKPELSFMEADMAAAGASPDSRLFSLGVQAMALTEMKYPNQAKMRYDELKSVWATQESIATNRVELEHKAMLLGLVAVGLYYRDPGLAKFGGDALGTISQLDYLPPLVDAVVAAQQGQLRQAVAQLQKAQQSEQFSAHTKALLAEVSALMASSPDQANLDDKLTSVVIAQTVQRVIEDIFRGDELRALLPSSSDLKMLMAGNKNVEAREVALPDSGAEATQLPPVLLSDELRAQGVVVTALRYSHGIHGDSSLLALVTLETKTELVTALELSACNSFSNVIKKSMVCLRPSPQTPAYTFLLPGLLNPSYVPKEPIAYFYLAAVSGGNHDKQ